MACRLMMFNIGDLTNIFADSRRVFPQKFLLETSSIGTRLFLPVPVVLPPDTIESDDELHRYPNKFDPPKIDLKSHFGIGSRLENSMNGMTPPLHPSPLAFQPVNEASSTAKTRSVCMPCWWRRKWRLPVVS